MSQWAGALALFVNLYDRLSRLERKIDLLLESAEIDLQEVARERARELLRAGNRREAVKEFQAWAGAKPAEAAAAIAELESAGSHRYEGSHS